MEEQQQGQGGGGSQLKTIARDLIEAGPETVISLLSEIFGQLSEKNIDPQAVVAEAMGGSGGGQQQQQMQPQGQPAAGGTEADSEEMAMAMAAAGGGQRGRITLR